MKELLHLVRLMREWTETRGAAPAHKVKDWADAIVATCAPVGWGAHRDLTIEEVRAEKALFQVYNRTARARTPFKAWLARATIAANTAPSPQPAPVVVPPEHSGLGSPKEYIAGWNYCRAECIRLNTPPQRDGGS
jgi:hypothetical protein